MRCPASDEKRDAAGKIEQVHDAESPSVDPYVPDALARLRRARRHRLVGHCAFQCRAMSRHGASPVSSESRVSEQATPLSRLDSAPSS